jgi:hypothetical protein
MTTRFWIPAKEGPPDERHLVACVASASRLHVILEGPRVVDDASPYASDNFGIPRVFLPDGEELRFMGNSGGNSKGGQRYYARFMAPPEPPMPLKVRTSTEPGEIIWEVEAIPYL